jgi:CRISPR-associated protein Csm4
MIKTFKTYYLYFNSPLHIGNHRPDDYDESESFLRSDTLVAAIYATWAKMGNSDWIPESGDPPFTLSSAFPFWARNEEDLIHFFPKLKVTPSSTTEFDTVTIKSLKKVQWIDKGYFEKVLKMESTDQFGDNQKDIQGLFLTSSALPEDGFMIKEETNRVTIPRNREKEGQNSTPFHMERLRFQNGGLFFIADGEDLNRLEKALDLLQYEGFGTDRNVGNGFFSWKSGNISIKVPDSGEYGTNLSLYCPFKSELNTQLDENSRFELIKRGGWITTLNYQTIEKNSIYMFSEGSVFKENRAVAGRGGIDITPYLPIDHPIFRCGKSIFLPINL